MVCVTAPLVPSKSIRFTGPLWLGLASPYIPTNWVPSLFHDSNCLLCVSGNGCCGMPVDAFHKRRRPSFCPPALATSLVPSGERAWQPTQVVPSVLAGVRYCAAVLVLPPKSQRMIAVLPLVVQ